MMLISKVMTGPLFTRSIIASKSYSGVFLSQDSYLELLRLADNYFGLITRQHLKFSYMLITRDQEHIWKGIGKHASLKVYQLLYDAESGVLAALVAMKNNFTCNKIPHIILTKPATTDITDAEEIIISVVASANINKVKTLPIPIKVHGKIGVISTERGSANRQPDSRSTPDIGRSTPDIGRSTPDIGRSTPDIGRSTPDIDTMKITIDNGRKTGSDTGALYNGEPVFSGPRGGRYIIKNGRKKYLKDDEATQSDVVYKINIKPD